MFSFLNLFKGFIRYLDMNGFIIFTPTQHYWGCTVGITINWTSNMCSILFILNMTFDRFYSIIRPHKAASFNTVKRAKITIVTCILLSIVYNCPHLFITAEKGRQCIPYGKALDTLIGQIYNWLSYVTSFVLPFVLLLTMNTVIIHT